MGQWTTHSAAPVGAARGNPAHFENLRHLAASLRLVADETRLRLLSLLIQNEEMNVTALCAELEQSQPAISHHLAMLRDAGLVQLRRQGKHNFYRCISEKLDSVTDIRWREVMVPDMMSAPDVIETRKS